MALKAAADNNRVANPGADTGRLLFSVWRAGACARTICTTIFFNWAISFRQPSTVGQ